MAFSHIRDDVSSKQASKKTDFTVDLIWWGSLRLAPTITMYIFIITNNYKNAVCDNNKQFI